MCADRRTILIKLVKIVLLTLVWNVKDEIKLNDDIKHEANMAHRSPEKHFLTINKLQQRYDFTSTKVKITNYKTKFVISLLRKGMTLCL